MKTVTRRSVPTIRDVARRADVSPGTVSRVLNGSPLVGAATRERVLQAIQDLNFKPNLVARRLSIRKTLQIAVIVYMVSRPSSVDRLDGIINALSESQYDVLVHNVKTPTQRDYYFSQAPHGERVDGVIVIALPPQPEQIETLAASGIPIIFVDTHHPGLEAFDRVVGDDVEGGRLATWHLIELGHRQIGFIGDLPAPAFQFTSSRDRAAGYRKALQEAGIAIDERYYAEDTHGLNTARAHAHEMLTMPEPPTAIFAASDTQAMGVLAAARDLGLRVPDDVSVIGYDDIEISDYLGLTTVRQHLSQSGEVATELLLSRLSEPEQEPQLITMSSEVIVRSTTGPLE